MCNRVSPPGGPVVLYITGTVTRRGKTSFSFLFVGLNKLKGRQIIRQFRPGSELMLKHSIDKDDVYKFYII
jgi:hypothetical protein